MSGVVQQADGRPDVARLWTVVKAAGAVIAVIPPCFAAWLTISTPPSVVKAREIVQAYGSIEYQSARAHVDAQVQGVLDRLRPSAPTTCSGDRESWTADCLAAREAYQAALVREFEEMMSTPDERKQFILIANYYMNAMKCVDSGDCDRKTIDAQFRNTIGLFWRQTWPYIQKAAESDIEYAVWLRDYCGTADKCKLV